MDRERATGRSGWARRMAVVFVGVALATVPMACGDDEPEAADTSTSAKATTTTEADGGGAAGAPGAADVWEQDAQQYRGEDGTTYTVDCTPEGTESTVWGTGTYTDDSSICTAAVQSGLITFDEGGEVTYEIAPGEDAYAAGTANGVTSQRYGTWGGSFTFPDAPPGSVEFTIGAESWKVRGTDFRDQEGPVTVQCGAGGPIATAWGTGTYTHDSSVCTAAVHHGLITVDEGGVVVIEAAPGQDSYEGSEANGVTSQDYGAYDGSFTFPDEQPVE